MYDKFREANLPMGGKVYLPRVESNPHKAKKQRASNTLDRVSNKTCLSHGSGNVVNKISEYEPWRSDRSYIEFVCGGCRWSGRIDVTGGITTYFVCNCINRKG
jgi:hypothetical protein